MRESPDVHERTMRQLSNAQFTRLSLVNTKWRIEGFRVLNEVISLDLGMRGNMYALTLRRLPTHYCKLVVISFFVIQLGNMSAPTLRHLPTRYCKLADAVVMQRLYNNVTKMALDGLIPREELVQNGWFYTIKYYTVYTRWRMI